MLPDMRRNEIFVVHRVGRPNLDFGLRDFRLETIELDRDGLSPNLKSQRRTLEFGPRAMITRQFCLTESVDKVVFKKSVSPQICQLILYYY